VVGSSSNSSAEKDAALARMAGKLSHQFNNILAVIKGNVTFLREMGGCSPDMDEVMVDIESAMDTAIDLTGRLQRFAGHSALRPESVDLRIVVEMAIAQMMNDHRDVIFHALLPARPYIVEVDVGHAQEAIAEMGRNAVAAHSRNIWIGLSPVLDEQAHGVSRRKMVHLEIRDDGQGMSAEVLDKAKEPLFTTRKDSKAAGWGLSGVAGFVRQSGGYMEMDSAPGRGTRIAIHLPVA
jgi:signal transduction histidine kinase